MDKDEEYISYRINTHNKYLVFKSSYGGKDYYKICFEKKNADNSKTRIYRSIKFVNCEPPEDRDMIRIKKGFEDNYIDPKNKFNDVCVIVVQDYEKFEDEEKLQKQAYENFHRTIEDNDFFKLSEDSLPF